MLAIVDRLAATFSPTNTPDDQVQQQRPSVDAPIDEVAGLLSAERRRWAIAHVAEHDETTTAKMANVRAREEYGPAFTGTQRKREYVSLYQNHLPELADAGVIQYDDHIVHPGPNFDGYADALERLCQVCTGGDRL